MSWDTDRIASYLDETVIPIRLSFLARDGCPRVASHWFVYDGGRLWCAVQSASFVARCLGEDPRCAFEVAADEPPYRGVRGHGAATLERARGPEVLRRLIARYLGDRDPELQRFLLERAGDEVAIRIDPERWTTWDFSDRMSTDPSASE